MGQEQYHQAADSERCGVAERRSQQIVDPPSNPPQASQPPATYRIFIRTRYERYIGEFVLHCHILDHEDQGMMQNVSIGLPDGAGGLANAHHHGGLPETK